MNRSNAEYVTSYLSRVESSPYGAQLSPAMATEIAAVIADLQQQVSDIELELAKLEHHLHTRAERSERA